MKNGMRIRHGSLRPQRGLAAPVAVNPVSGPISEATRILGMTPRQIAYRIQTLNIEVKQF